MEGIVGGIFESSGQSCVAGSRLFVQHSAHHKLMNMLAKRASATQTAQRIHNPLKLSPARARSTGIQHRRLGRAVGRHSTGAVSPSSPKFGYPPAQRNAHARQYQIYNMQLVHTQHSKAA
ncbi:aldehyde dehydrogenase family protein [Castellaniella sp. GW247-6E4]|uniref:aldehyde dehydrogenase family protein n=1 Tax=Castellaniella sp. GW247-6E4 TaxID=3140380 RepID=UPI00331566F8